MSSPGRILEQHNEAVADISRSVRGYYDRGQKFRINHGSTNSTRISAKGSNTVDLSRLNNVLHINRETKTALVEPNVPMDRLVEATMEHGLIPPVVMDFPGITVGGGFAGTSGESSSFRHGFFDRTMNWVEMVLANGDVVRCSESERLDLLGGAAGAVGSLGTTTLVELRLNEAKPFVELTYHPVSSMKEAVSETQKYTSDPEVEYLDGIMYSPTQGAIIVGRTSSAASPSAPLRRFSAASDPWYYLHVQSAVTASPKQSTTETLPLAEYLFRYDRGGFWVGKLAFQYFSFVPFNKWTRWFLDDFMHTRMMYTALHSGGAGRDLIVQDLALPYESAEEFVDYTDKNFGIWPLWLCPLKTPAGPSLHPHLRNGKSGDMLNIGLWGFAPKPERGVDEYMHYVDVNRGLERKLKQLGGMKWLYAQTFYPENEFWATSSAGEEAGADGGEGDRKWYDDLRMKYHAQSLPTAYEKVKTDVARERERRQSWQQRLCNIWPLGGFLGIWKAIQSKSYLVARRSTWKTIGQGKQSSKDKTV